MLSRLGQFSNSSQMQDIRAQIHGALAEIEIEAEGRIRVVPCSCAKITRSEGATQQYSGASVIGTQKRDAQ